MFDCFISKLSDMTYLISKVRLNIELITMSVIVSAKPCKTWSIRNILRSQTKFGSTPRLFFVGHEVEMVATGAM